MEELKAAVIKQLESCTDRDEPYLAYGQRTLTLNQILEEVKTDTKFGKMWVADILGAALDIVIKSTKTK